MMDVRGFGTLEQERCDFEVRARLRATVCRWRAQYWVDHGHFPPVDLPVVNGHDQAVEGAVRVRRDRALLAGGGRG